MTASEISQNQIEVDTVQQVNGNLEAHWKSMMNGGWIGLEMQTKIGLMIVLHGY